MDKRTAVFMGFIITICALIISEAIVEAYTPKPVEIFPDLDEVTKWRLHREVQQILKEGI